jgi:hypothetical protein
MVNAWVGGVGAPPLQPDFSTEMMYGSMYSERALLITMLSSEVLILHNSLTYCVVFFILNVFILNLYIAGLLMECLPNSQSLNLFISVLQFTLQFLCKYNFKIGCTNVCVMLIIKNR